MAAYTDRDGNRYYTRVYNNILIFEIDRPDGTFTKKNIKVVDDSSVIYKLQKTQIRADGSAEGLDRWLSKYTSYNDFAAALAEKVYKHVFANM